MSTRTRIGLAQLTAKESLYGTLNSTLVAGCNLHSPLLEKLNGSSADAAGKDHISAQIRDKIGDLPGSVTIGKWIALDTAVVNDTLDNFN